MMIGSGKAGVWKGGQGEGKEEGSGYTKSTVPVAGCPPETFKPYDHDALPRARLTALAGFPLRGLTPPLPLRVQEKSSNPANHSRSS